ncbi:MAG: nucleoside deaminase [Candidatus Omnitrophota bacterium]
MNKHDRKFMRLTIEKAKEGIGKGQTPFAATIVKGDTVLSCVHNIVWQTQDITAHAEINAIRTACKKLKSIDLSGCVIYSTCEPCPMCFSACHWARISRVIFGANIADAKVAGFNELLISNLNMHSLAKSAIEVTGNFMRRENLLLFSLWKRAGAALAY